LESNHQGACTQSQATSVRVSQSQQLNLSGKILIEHKSASKKLAELAAWDFVEAEKPSFSLATVNPPMICSPVAQVNSTANLNQSAVDIWDLMTGHTKNVPPTPLPACCDVRDVAQTHLKALEHSTGGRFLPVGGRFLLQDVCAILRDVAPKWAELIPDPEGEPRQEYFEVDNSWTNMSFRGLKETITDTVESFRAMQVRGSCFN
jgi:nucleoside-diphosphate-sugar epimerase